MTYHAETRDGQTISPQKMTFESFEHFFRALTIESGDGTIFAFQDLITVAANDRACDLYGLSQEEIRGRDIRTLFAPGACSILDRALSELEDYQSWAGEVVGMRQSEEKFTIDLTIKRIPLDDCFLICLVIRDLTEYKMLKKLLQEEKSHRHAMYTTMRNLMKAFEKENTGIEGMISHRIETLLLPAIERLKKEASPEIRNMYLDILRGQLLDLTKGFNQSLDGRFLSLTATELKVCSWIKQGYSTKEIALKHGLSFETVQAHRRNIRKKLKIRGKKVNLFAVLSSKSFFYK